MDKRAPHYDLAEIQADVRKRGITSFTMTARRNGLVMGLTTAEMVDVVSGLSQANFSQSMTAPEDPGLWRDLYHAMTPVGKVAYIAMTGLADGRPPVIQFQEKPSWRDSVWVAVIAGWCATTIIRRR